MVAAAVQHRDAALAHVLHAKEEAVATTKEHDSAAQFANEALVCTATERVAANASADAESSRLTSTPPCSFMKLLCF